MPTRSEAPTAATKAAAALPVVALVGRPNVGKSTLFNRLVHGRRAIVQDLPGTTRDRIYGVAEWRGHRFRVVDTGGLLGEQLAGPYADEVATQVRHALGESDAVCLVVDAQAGPVPTDAEIAFLLRDAVQPTYLVVNKADNDALAANAADFYELGLGEPHPLSAHHSRGVADLLDAIVDWLPPGVELPEAAACRIAIVGRPNVGKSSIVNALLQDERMIVSPVAGTTRDAVDTPLTFRGEAIVLVDTAGLRRRGRIQTGLEKASVRRTRSAIERADVVAVVIDASQEVGAQDQHILGMALDAYKGVILVLNKADLIADDPELIDRRRRQMDWRARSVPWAPVIWTSAFTGEHLHEILGTAQRVRVERARRVPTGPLNALLKRAAIAHPPATHYGHAIKFFYATQAEVDPPAFVFFCNYPQAIHFSYERYLAGRIREEFGFGGTAIRLLFRTRAGAAKKKARHG